MIRSNYLYKKGAATTYISLDFLRFSILILSFFSFSAHSTTMEQTVKMSTAMGSICKTYAEEVGGDVNAFAEMNLMSMQIAEKSGYTNDLQSYLSEVNFLKNALQDQLLKEYGTKINVYNKWCPRVYNGFKKGLANAYN